MERDRQRVRLRLCDSVTTIYHILFSILAYFRQNLYSPFIHNLQKAAKIAQGNG